MAAGLQEGNGWWQELGAMLGVFGITGAAVWQLVKGKLQSDKTKAEALIETDRVRAEVKVARDKYLLEREALAYTHLQDLLEPYRKDMQLLRDERDALEKRIDQLEEKVAELQKENIRLEHRLGFLDRENMALREGIKRLCEQVIQLERVPVFCYEPSISNP